MSQIDQTCAKCKSFNAYQDGSIWICPVCFHEWAATFTEEKEDGAPKFVDANGVALANGDTVTLTKDLKLGKETLKSGTKVKNIRLLDEPVDDHDISCKIPGFGSLYLKCSVVKKTNQ